MQKLLIVKWLGGKVYGLREIKLLQECSGPLETGGPYWCVMTG